MGRYDVFIQRNTPSPLVSIPELNQESDFVIKVYPNPSQDKIKIDFEKEYKTIMVKIYDAKGNLRQEQNYLNERLVEIDVRGEGGIHFIELLINKTERKTVKILKK